MGELAVVIPGPRVVGRVFLLHIAPSAHAVGVFLLRAFRCRVAAFGRAELSAEARVGGGLWSRTRGRA